MQTQTIHYQQGKFRPIQPEPATQVVNKPATNSSKQRHFQTEKNRARAAYKQLPDRESNNKQSIVKPVETTEISVAYQQHIQEKQDIHMAEITWCKLSKKREVGNPMLCQGKHATNNPGKKHHRGGKIGENLPWPEALWRRKQPWCGINKERHQSMMQPYYSIVSPTFN
jgi:hypothetical protein